MCIYRSMSKSWYIQFRRCLRSLTTTSLDPVPSLAYFFIPGRSDLFACPWHPLLWHKGSADRNCRLGLVPASRSLAASLAVPCRWFALLARASPCFTLPSPLLASLASLASSSLQRRPWPSCNRLHVCMDTVPAITLLS